jgi:predicted DNA-binding mobile mystery protein A
MNNAIKHRRLILQQLGARVEKFKWSTEVGPPVKGWIKSIRKALGMSGSQLAERMNVAQPRISRLEKDELTGSVTLKTMRQAAEAMDCVFVYAIVPRTSLDDVIQTQAEIVAKERLSRSSHTMMLEDQQLSNCEQKRMWKDMVDDLVRECPRDLWQVRKQS